MKPIRQIKLSAIVLTLDEEEFLPGCLTTLAWVDEILVIDAGSSDQTRRIAASRNARVIHSPWKGFPQQRNRGASEASGDWLLYVDADERVSPKLREEIRRLLSQGEPAHASYKVPHRNIILGKWLRYGGWYPEYQHRLINKTAFIGWQGALHEHPEVKGTVGYLTGDLIHLTHRGMRWMLAKSIKYTRLEAQLRLATGHPKVRARHLLSAMAREFWYRGVKMGGWRDGMIGWIEIIYQALNQFLIMAWLWEMQRGRSMEEEYKHIDRELINEL